MTHISLLGNYVGHVAQVQFLSVKYWKMNTSIVDLIVFVYSSRLGCECFSSADSLKLENDP